MERPAPIVERPAPIVERAIEIAASEEELDALIGGPGSAGLEGLSEKEGAVEGTTQSDRTDMNPADLALEEKCPTDRGAEMKAMLGQLEDDTLACMEERYKTAVLLTTRDKVSRVLIANAFGHGDKAQWEQKVARHLKEVGQSDPDMCYKYASHLYKRSSSRSSEVVYWSNRALENRHIWTGDGHVSRVYALHKMRTNASLRAWEVAGQRFAANPSTEAQRSEELARIETKTYAREWIDYSAEAGRNTADAVNLCVSATGDNGFCASN